MRGVHGAGYRRSLFVSAFVMLSLLGVTYDITSHAAIPADENHSTPATDGAGLGALDAIKTSGGYFVENRGQVNELVRFYSTGNPSVGFRDDGVMFVVRETRGGESREAWRDRIARFAAVDETTTVKSFAYMLRFEGSNKVEPIGIDRLPFNSNFFIGSNPTNWKTGVMNFREIVYEDLYEGIDLVYRMDSRGVKYEFIVGPGSNPQTIGMKFEGIESLRTEDGALLMQTPFGVIREEPPWSYQYLGDEIDCRFAVRDRLSFGYRCDSWDVSRPLIVDPLVYSTFLGGNGQEAPNGWSRIAIDSLGYAYVTSQTDSVDFPVTVGAFDRTLAARDVFVTKLNPTGSGLVYSTYLGGGGEENSQSLTVDDEGCVYVTGTTTSDDFPVTAGALGAVFNGGTGDSFVTEFNATGSGLVYSTYLGGSGFDRANSVTLDRLGNAYLTGETDSTDLPTTPNAFRSNRAGVSDSFVAELNADGSALVYSTYFGGADADRGFSIAIDDKGTLSFVGHTYSIDLPVTAGAYDTTYAGNGDIFVARMDPATGVLIFSTFIGWTGNDGPYSSSIALDSSGDVFVTGTTTSVNFPVTAGSFDMNFNGGTYDAYVFMLNSSGDRLVYSTLLGGGSGDQTLGIVVDSSNNAYVVGTTGSSDFPTTPGAYSRSFSGNADMFVTKLDEAGATLKYSTYLGGTWWEQGTSIAVDNDGMIYVAGNTDSTDFPTTPGAFDRVLVGSRDASVTKLNPNVIFDPPDLVINPPDLILDPPTSVVAGTPVTIDATVHNFGGSNASNVVVRFHDGPPSGSNQIGTDQVIPFIPYFTGTGIASTVWISGPPGLHDICAVADPDDAIDESHEDNNMACVPVQVLSLPDLTPTSIVTLPPSPIPEGTLSQVNVTIVNAGDLAAGGFDILLFDDTNGNLAPDTGEDIGVHAMAGIAGHSQSYEEFSWSTAPADAHSICAFADPPPGTVTESNETNNAICIDVLVQPGPVLRPDYVPVTPLPLPPIKVGLSSRVSLSIQVHNQGNATAKENATLAFYDDFPPAVPFASFIVTPILVDGDSSRFTATWTSPANAGIYFVSVDVDHESNVTEWDETNNVYTWTIEVVSGPITSLSIGSPNHTSPASAMYVRSSTPLDLSVVDQSGAGINHTWYRIDNDTWTEYSSSFFLSVEGDHYVEWYSEDNAGNVEDVSWRVLRVDNAPPATAVSIGEPKYLTDRTYVNSSTQLAFSAVDGGVGSNSTFYRLWSGSWSSWGEYSSPFSLAGKDGTWYAEFLSFDYLGNVEIIQNDTLVLDNMPPVTTITLATVITLAATDSGCGVNVTMYSIDGGTPIRYDGGFTLQPGEHNISYFSIDFLGNRETERHRIVMVKEPPTVETNYKPIVALVFAVVLVVAGFWSSKRRPWKGRKDKMAVAKAFAITSMPFVLLEVVTGMISSLTESLSIPPLLGVGTAVDSSILIAGLAVSLFRFFRHGRDSDEETEADTSQ